MREVPASITEAWKAEDKTGDRRPAVRATISKLHLRRFPYDTRWAGVGDIDWEQQRSRMGTFTTMLFGTEHTVREIHNIKSYTWKRTAEEDVATCSMVIQNSELVPIGDSTREYGAQDTYDLPGWFTANRNDSHAQARWGIVDSGWDDFFMPDRVVKTYEGYGYTLGTSPGLDPKLVQSGTWIIDSVTYGADGVMTLQMRDLGRLLIDQIVFPPVIPYEEYPLSWSKIRSELVPGREPAGGKWSGKLIDLGKASSSNERYVAREAQSNFAIDPSTNQPYVDANGNVWGHSARDAITKTTGAGGLAGSSTDVDNPEPYWLSTGQSAAGDFVWWEFDFDDPRVINALRLNVYGGPYRVYISLKGSDGKWRGRRKVPYHGATTKGINLQADKPFVRSAIMDRGKTRDVLLKRKYKGIKKVRLTFTHLWDTKTSTAYPWRAGLKNIQLYINKGSDPTGDDMKFVDGEHYEILGNYKDYTDIVKWVGAWGGFFWPGRDSASSDGDIGEDYIRLGWMGPNDQMIDVKRYIRYDHADERLPKGRVWGDFMQTGTAGIAELTVDQFDKQPLMDVISYVRDLTGFYFAIDEQGAMVWRMPNIWQKGNYLSPTQLGAPTRARTQEFVTLDEETTLTDYSMELNSENSREVIFVANLVGNYGSTIRGYAPSNARLRRTAGWTDARFKGKEETRRMADLIATRQMFNYRRGRASTPGNPAIQVDDQIRIYERVTAETYFHYVQGIECNLDMESGTYTYDLDTHWLGQSESEWVFKTEELASTTTAYIKALGIGDLTNDVPADVFDDDVKDK